MHTKDTRAMGESEQALVNLTMAVVAINGWNRLAISFHWLAGRDRPKRSRLT
jgi:hypothetical protein